MEVQKVFNKKYVKYLIKVIVYYHSIGKVTLKGAKIVLTGDVKVKKSLSQD